MEKILFTLLLTFTCLNISAQTKNTQNNEYYIYKVFYFPTIEIQKGVWRNVIIYNVNYDKKELVSEQNRPLLFDSKGAAQNYLYLQGWIEHSASNLANVYKKKVSKEVLIREVEKNKETATYEEVLKAYNRDREKYGTMVGYKLVDINGQVDISEK